ncbi:POTRA domain-containing protein [Fusobacterium sp. 1001295B_180824_G3]|uniref:POTRA domain-containing protein n=2 Tax=Fusobacteriaceae TaxID=203492 RepID=UPI000424F0E7|nr:POTRA domain-containing protein [Fusobacterium nucleatum]
MFRKIFLLSILIFSFSYAVDEIDIEKRRQQQDFNVPKNIDNNGQKNLILDVVSTELESNTMFEDFQIDAILRRYIGKDRDIYAFINELENKYIEKGYVTTKVGLNTEKSDLENGKISLFVLEGKIDKE